MELDVLNLKDKDVAAGKDQGHIIDLGALPEKKEPSQRRKAKASPSAGIDTCSSNRSGFCCRIVCLWA